MLEAKGKVDSKLNHMLDSAIKLFPNDGATFRQTKVLFNRWTIDVNNKTANDYEVDALKAFEQGQYVKAANCFIKAANIDPTNYTHAENIGMCLYNSQKYLDAITYFNKSIALGTSITGKSEYYLGMSYIARGKKIEACNALQLANNKKYPDAAASIKSNCQ